MSKTVISINDLTKSNIIVQVGVDKDNIPVYVGDTIVEEVSYEFSSDFFDRMDDRAARTCRHDINKQMCSGKVYREVTFNGYAFQLIRVRVEGYLPKGECAEEWATQRNLSKIQEGNMREGRRIRCLGNRLLLTMKGHY